MKSFVALDVETANYSKSSVCSIGCVKVIEGKIADTFYSLVHPTPNWYARKCMEVHGLSDDDTWDAPPFDAVWRDVIRFADGLPFVAHNAQFDYGCISAACQIYQLEPPSPFYCTLVAARQKIPRYVLPSKGLASLCDFFGIPLDNHHNALADAEACAKLAIVLEEV